MTGSRIQAANKAYYLGRYLTYSIVKGGVGLRRYVHTSLAVQSRGIRPVSVAQSRVGRDDRGLSSVLS